MVYDYYEILKKKQESDEYTEVSDIVREELWRDLFENELSKEWIETETKMLISLYILLRYS